VERGSKNMGCPHDREKDTLSTRRVGIPSTLHVVMNSKKEEIKNPNPSGFCCCCENKEQTK